ncbi:MAG: thiamine pyrophosphate-binding protein [Pseudomonadales bacterium]|nr:thiamine pyrophosphate-binding protein [Pseudomonadales bacterium]NRA14138.1 acetolactate synthase [Oceanospirillaceae bacterium]
MSTLVIEKLTGGEAAVKSLHKHKISTLFCIPGVQNDWFFNALYDLGDGIRVIHTRHEQGAAYMALGYAQATGKVGMFSVVPGPGLLNASAALATAYALNAKVFCLTGQIPSQSIGKELGVLHEINNQLDILKSLTKHADRANCPDDVPRMIDEGFRQMHSAMPRPVALEIPMDILAAKAMVNISSDIVAGFQPPLDTEQVIAAAQLLGKAQRPMIFVGSGAQDVSPQVTELANMLQAPVIGYRTGKGILDARHYLSLQQPAAKDYWMQADVVIAIGTNMRVPVQKWAKQHLPKIIRIDVDPRSHNKFIKPALAITAQAQQALPLLLQQLPHCNIARPSRESEMTVIRSDWEKKVSVLDPQMTYLKIIREELGEDGIFVDELTQIGFASRIAYPAYKPRTYITTGYQGTLGYGFQTAIGVKVARPDVPVISVCGDGGFMFGVQELATAVQHKIPVCVLLFNNNQYGNVQEMQRNDYDGRVIATDLHNPDFIAMAAAFGAQAIRANSFDELRAAIRASHTVDVPTIIEIPVGDMPSVNQFR